MTEFPSLIVLAGSARALAASAKRAGYAPLAIDVFGDADTRALCRATVTLEGGLSQGLRHAALVDAVASLGRAYGPIGVVYGAGFEDKPDIVAALARETRLIGVSAPSLKRAKDPRELALVCKRANVAHPEIAFELPDAVEGWLQKSAGGSGGEHVRLATTGVGAGQGRYFQRRIEGRSVSALFAADGASVSVIGLSEQWTAPSPRSPFRYGGAAGPIDVEPGLGGDIDRVVAALAGELGLVGLCSADFIVSGAQCWLIEINPRPGATLDVFDCDEDPLMTRHIEACEGRIRPPIARPTRKAAEVVYAGRDFTVPAEADWPDWVADRSVAGTRIVAQEPVCTVLGAAPDAKAARLLAAERVREVNARVEGWAT